MLVDPSPGVQGCGADGGVGGRGRRTYDGRMPLVEPAVLVDAVRAELATVLDPEIRRPITELGMVRSVDVGPDGTGGTLVTVGLDLTTPGCPLKETLTRDITAAASRVAGVDAVHVAMGVMSPEQRTELRSMLRGAPPSRSSRSRSPTR